MISRRISPLTLDNVLDFPDPCRQCVFWELDPVAGDRAQRRGDTAECKRAWLSQALLEWGSVGMVAYVDSAFAGYLTYAPPHLVPRSLAFATAPVSADAVLLATGRVLPQYAGGGLGRMLMQAVARDLTRRGVRAIEAYGVPSEDEREMDPRERAARAGGCLLPQDYLLAVGFTTVRAHPRHPRLRLDLRTALSWRGDVELAVERLLGSVRVVVPSGG